MLLNTAYKICAMVIGKRLKKEIEDKELTPETQAGFRSGRSTIDNIFILNYVVNKELQVKGGKLCTFFADLKAAFDKLKREKLSQMVEERAISQQLRGKRTTFAIRIWSNDCKIITFGGPL